MPPILKKVGGRGALVFLCLWLGLLAVGREKMLRDPGTFWHPVVGERMLQTGTMIQSDPFSFTQLGRPWIAQQWLGEIIMALLHRIGGIDALLLAATALLAGVFASLGARLHRAGLPWPVAVVLLMLVMASSSYHFLPRPHLVTIALMAASFALLCDIESGRLPISRLLALPPMMILWTNLHGGALGGLATILIVAICWLVRSFKPQPIQLTKNSAARWIGVTVCLSAIAILVNPYGAKLPATWLGLMTSKLLPQIIIEHGPLQFATTEGSMILSLAAVYGIVLFRAWPTHRRTTWLIPMIWFLLTLTRVRHGPLFAVTAAIAIADMLPHARLPACFQIADDAGVQDGRRGVGPLSRTLPIWFVASLCLFIALLANRSNLPLPLIGQGLARVPNDYWPTGTAMTLRKESQELDNPPRVFNDLVFGGYLIYHVPQARIYIDDRCELYGDQGLRTYIRACREPDFFEALARYEEYDLALVQHGSLLAEHLAGSARWNCIASDPASTLYRRAKG